LASGIWLLISSQFSSKAAQSVFMALCVHKSYEAMIFFFILINRQLSQLSKTILLGFYAFSLPSLRQIQKLRFEMCFIVLGLILTQIVLRGE